ncbi:MAG: nucleotidyltransferase domain-containing protein [Clostridia bacterium]|nr:nucleotidyltransferase domain-containing protein [Clostridia bacterium]
MDRSKASALHTRNRAIIDAIIKKAEQCCPDALDLIAITGSFSRDDYYELSDLDLLIVINDPAGYRLAKCFALGDVGHDIYCQSWERLEHASTYPDPHVDKLLHAKIVYCREDSVWERYQQLGEALRSRMASAPNAETLAAINTHMAGAWQDFGRLMLEEDFGRCRYYAAGVLYRIEYAVYMRNGALIGHGIRGIPAEICALPHLPEDFAAHYHALIEAETAEETKRELGALLRATDEMIACVRAQICPRRPLTADALRGTHEEIRSNWRNKMYRAAKEGDRYLAWMSEAATQEFYNEMASEYEMSPVVLMDGASEQDLLTRAHRFDDAMRMYGENYIQTGTPFCRYDTVAEFVTDYLK